MMVPIIRDSVDIGTSETDFTAWTTGDQREYTDFPMRWAGEWDPLELECVLGRNEERFYVDHNAMILVVILLNQQEGNEGEGERNC